MLTDYISASGTCGLHAFVKGATLAIWHTAMHAVQCK